MSAKGAVETIEPTAAQRTRRAPRRRGQGPPSRTSRPPSRSTPPTTDLGALAVAAGSRAEAGRERQRRLRRRQAPALRARQRRRGAWPARRRRCWTPTPRRRPTPRPRSPPPRKALDAGTLTAAAQAQRDPSRSPASRRPACRPSPAIIAPRSTPARWPSAQKARSRSAPTRGMVTPGDAAAFLKALVEAARRLGRGSPRPGEASRARRASPAARPLGHVAQAAPRGRRSRCRVALVGPAPPRRSMSRRRRVQLVGAAELAAVLADQVEGPRRGGPTPGGGVPSAPGSPALGAESRAARKRGLVEQLGRRVVLGRRGSRRGGPRQCVSATSAARSSSSEVCAVEARGPSTVPRARVAGRSFHQNHV